ncbi:MAG: septal ring lytic transglycosylase RlpA family protein [Acidobacteria bacterium]|nr:septal ring lytic transglycosylase RlpA family protein [Acidobacteriota bacterium]
MSREKCILRPHWSKKTFPGRIVLSMERPFHAVSGASRVLWPLIAVLLITICASACSKRKRVVAPARTKPPASTNSRPGEAKKPDEARRDANVEKTVEAPVPAARRSASKPAQVETPSPGVAEEGIASWYGEPYHGRRAANGEIYDMEKLTAAHRTFPFGLWVQVENLLNNKTVDVRITDRGPFIDGRIIDLSRAAARAIELIGPGIARVRLTVIDPPEAPPSPPSPPTQPLPSMTFAVQVGAFASRINAEKVADSLRAELGHAVIRTREGSRPLHLVLAGKLANEEQARELAARLASRFRQAFVVSLDHAAE